MFEKLKQSSHLPSIGSKEAKAKLEFEAQQKYYEEMADKLAEWEIENECAVEALLSTPQNARGISFQAVLNFRKLDNIHLNNYKREINEKRDKSKQVQGQKKS